MFPSGRGFGDGTLLTSIRVFPVAALTVALASCGGGGSSPAAPQQTAVPPAPTPVASVKLDLTGAVTAGSAACALDVASLDGQSVGNGQSDSSGAFSVELENPDAGVYILSASNCTYSDEFTGEVVSGVNLRAPFVVPELTVSGRQSLNVTPLTEVLTRVLTARTEALSPEDVSRDIAAFSQIWLGDAQGLAATLPAVSVTNAAAAADEAAAMHGLLLANISAMGDIDETVALLASATEDRTFVVEDIAKMALLDAAHAFEDTGRNKSGRIATLALAPLMADGDMSAAKDVLAEAVKPLPDIEGVVGERLEVDLKTLFSVEETGPDRVRVLTSALPRGLRLTDDGRVVGKPVRANSKRVVVTVYYKGFAVARILTFNIAAAPENEPQPEPQPDPQPDPEPYTWEFGVVTDAEPGEFAYSGIKTVSDNAGTLPISVAKGWYRVDGGAWTQAEGTIGSGQTFQVRVRASGEPGVTVGVTLTIGEFSDRFEVTTAAAPAPEPEPDDTSPPQFTVESGKTYEVTTDSRTTIRGTASDASGVAGVTLTVNGNPFEATSSDGFKTWQASVNLNYGKNAMSVRARDSRGNATAEADAQTLIRERFNRIIRDRVQSSTINISGENWVLIRDAKLTGLRNEPAIAIRNSNNVVVRRCNISDVDNSHAVVIDSSKDVSIERCSIVDVAGGRTNSAINIDYSQRVRVQNNTIRKVHTLGHSAGVRMRYGDSDITIADNEISDMWGNGIESGGCSSCSNTATVHDHPNPNLVIRRNLIHDVGLTPEPVANSPLHGMYIKAQDATVEDNIVYNSVDGSGLSMRTTSTVRRNKVWDTKGEAIAYYGQKPSGPSDTVRVEDNIAFQTSNRPSGYNAYPLRFGWNTRKSPANKIGNYIITGNTFAVCGTEVNTPIVNVEAFDGMKFTLRDNLIINEGTGDRSRFFTFGGTQSKSPLSEQQLIDANDTRRSADGVDLVCDPAAILAAR